MKHRLCLLLCSGNVNGGSDNLSSKYYDAYVDYLTEVVQYFKDELNVTFQTVEPFNEPSSAWQLGNDQEGCHYEASTQRTILLVRLECLLHAGFCCLCPWTSFVMPLLDALPCDVLRLVFHVSSLFCILCITPCVSCHQYSCIACLLTNVWSMYCWTCV